MKRKAKEEEEGLDLLIVADVPDVTESRKPRKPKPQDIKLSASQYCMARGHRMERCGGFISEMKSTNKTRDAWDLLWTSYWNRKIN